MNHVMYSGADRTFVMYDAAYGSLAKQQGERRQRGR